MIQASCGNQSSWPGLNLVFDIEEGHPEVKQSVTVNVNAIKNDDLVLRPLNHFSC